MSTTIQGTLFLGETLGCISIEVTAASGRLQSTDAARTVDVSLADVQVSDRLAQVPRFLYLPGNRTIETADNAAVDALLSGQQRGRLVRIVHALESRAPVAAVATVLLVTLTAASLWWGLPVLAQRAAMAVPATVEYRAGRAGLASFNQVLGASGLARSERQRVQAQLDRLVRAGGIGARSELEFRSMGGAFPNAFALPGGIIVVSDELVRLTRQDDELAAVLAHEIGHWQQRHGLQTLLRSSAALLVVCTVTGDLSTLTTFAGTIPFTLLQRGYSREFEVEADAYAVQLLLKAKIDPRHFIAILQRLEEAQPKTGNDFSYLSTHPGTTQRIEGVYATARRLGWKDPGPLPVAPQAAPPKPAPARLSASARPATEKNPDVQPKALFRSAPVYPAYLRTAGVHGTVVVEFIIDENGDVRNATVARSSHRGFEAPALTAISQWKFEPGRKNSRAVKIFASQLLEFNTEDGPATTPPDASSVDRGVVPPGGKDGLGAENVVPVIEPEDHRAEPEQK